MKKKVVAHKLTVSKKKFAPGWYKNHFLGNKIVSFTKKIYIYCPDLFAVSNYFYCRLLKSFVRFTLFFVRRAAIFD